MSQNATLATIEATQSPAQSRALSALLAGETVTSAAERAGVARETVHRWLREPSFLAELNGGKAEILATVRANLRETAVAAAKFLHEALTSQYSNNTLKLKVSLAVLRMVGADEPEAIGPTDPDEIAVAERERKDDLGDRNLMAQVLDTFRRPGPHSLT